MRNIQLRNIIDAIMIIIIMILFEISYVTFINKYFSFLGYNFLFSVSKFAISNIILIVAVTINMLQKDLNYFVSSMLIVLMLLPNLIIYEFVPNVPFAIPLFVFITILILYLSSFVDVKTDKISFINNYKILTISIISILAFIPLFITYKFNLDFNVLLFEDIYKVRAEGVKKMGLITSYIYPWIVKIIFPIALILSLQYKKKALFILIFIAQIYLFIVQGHKSVFISAFLIFCYFIKDYQKQIRVVLSTIVFVVISTRILTLVTGNILIESIFIRRSFFVPAMNNVFYFDFFKDKPLYYSNSILGKFIDYPYHLLPPYLLGEKYYGMTNMSVNNGFISDGYMNIGIIGIILNIIGIIIYFKLLSKINISPIFSGIIIIIIFTLISSYFLTSLLTHGLILFLLLSFIILQDTNKSFHE